MLSKPLYKRGAYLIFTISLSRLKIYLKIIKQFKQLIQHNIEE
jgi:hypothetical protein